MPPRKSLGLPKFHTSARIQDAITVAKQYRSNRSNAEWMWYSPYVLTLESLLDVGHINNLIAPSRESLVPRPQGVVILSKEKLIQLEDIDDLLEDVLDIDPNSSFETTVSTTTKPADRKAIYGIPDCSIAHMASKPAVDGKFQVYHTCLPGLVENKKAPSRRPSGDGLTREILQSAQDQLLYYDAIYFAEHPTFTKIVNIPAAGPYWTWSLIQKAQVPSFDFMKLFMTANDDLDEDLPEKDWALYRAVAETVATNPIHILGTAESDIALADLRDKGLVPLIRSCGHAHFVVPFRPAGNGGGSEDVDDSTLPNGAVTDDGAVTEEDEDGDLGGYGEVNG